ncbi:MAG: hypothetical protein WBB19_06510 [Desulforhopalus sp.]
MFPAPGLLNFRLCLLSFLIPVLCLVPGNSLSAKSGEPEPLRLSFLGNSAGGADCQQHGPSAPPQAKKAKKSGGRPPSVHESEHRPVARRTYYFNEHRRRALIKAYVRQPGGRVIEPELRLGHKPNVSFTTPFGNGPAHGANNIYIVEQGVDNEVLTIRTAKWITMHHNCGWGHEGKFNETLTSPQPLETIPFEIVIDNLWDRNFHLSVTSGDRLGITVLSYGKPVPGAAVTVSSEQGWSKRVATDTNGRASVQLIRDYYPPLWSTFKRTHRGEFLVTASYDTDQRGNFRGDAYRHTRYITTFPWQYSPSTRDYASYSFGLALGLVGMTVSGFGVYIYRERRRKPYRGISFDK